MRTIQPDLINFSEFQALNLFDGKILISRTGIIHTKRETCPSCGCLCSYNGSSNKGKHVLSNSCGVFLRKGQQCCPNCGVSIQVDNEWLDEAIESFNKFIVSQVLSLSTNLSEDEIVKHLENTMSIKISKSTVHNIIKKSNEKFEDIEFDYEVKDHFYGYDEQYLKINGKRAYRLVFFDIKKTKLFMRKSIIISPKKY